MGTSCYFLKDDFHRVLRDEMILPFITEDQHAEGASGELSKSTIQISQQSFLPKMVSALFHLRQETALNFGNM